MNEWIAGCPPLRRPMRWRTWLRCWQKGGSRHRRGSRRGRALPPDPSAVDTESWTCKFRADHQRYGSSCGRSAGIVASSATGWRVPAPPDSLRNTNGWQLKAEERAMDAENGRCFDVCWPRRYPPTIKTKLNDGLWRSIILSSVGFWWLAHFPTARCKRREPRG